MIIWDLGGVVARFLPERRTEALATEARMSPAFVEEAIRTYGLGAEADSGQFTAEEVWARATAAFTGLDRETIRRCWALAFEPDPAVLGLVNVQPGASALLTNNGPILEACLEHELSSIADRFNQCLLSWRLGATKPSHVAFERAAVRLDRKPVRRRGSGVGDEHTFWTSVTLCRAVNVESSNLGITHEGLRSTIA